MNLGCDSADFHQFSCEALDFFVTLRFASAKLLRLGKKRIIFFVLRSTFRNFAPVLQNINNHCNEYFI